MLTGQDKQEVQQMITNNNDVLMSGIIDALKDIATKADIQTETAKCAKQENLLKLQDDMVQVKVDLGNLKLFTESNQQRIDHDITLVKGKLGLV